MLSLLPPVNCQIMKMLIEFFHDMLPHQAKTKMSAANLAIILAPNILRTREESLEQVMRDLGLED